MLQVVSESRQITLQQPKYGRLEVSHMLQEVTYIFHNKIVHQICRAKINGGVYFQFVRVIPFSKSIRKLIWRNLAKHLASSRNPINESNDGLNYLASAQLSSTGGVSKQSAIEATILWTKSQKVIPINSFPTDSSPQYEYPPYKLTDNPGPFSNCYVSLPEIIMTPNVSTRFHRSDLAPLIESTTPIHPLRPPAYFGYDNTSPYDLRCSSGKPWTPAKQSIGFSRCVFVGIFFCWGNGRVENQSRCVFHTKPPLGKIEQFKKLWRGGNLGEFLRWCLAAYESYEIRATKYFELPRPCFLVPFWREVK